MAKVDATAFHYSITVLTKRREVLYALRALSMAAQRQVNNKIPWSGVTDASWKARAGLATFHFTSNAFRKQFTEWAKELLPSVTWSYVGDSDDHSPDASESRDE